MSETVSKAAVEKKRADVRRILRYIRIANRIRETTTTHPFNVEASLDENGQKIVSMPDVFVIKSLLAEFRPLYLDSEECSFKNIIRILPQHVKIEGKDFADIEKRWCETLALRTAKLPVGTTFTGLVPGYKATAVNKPGVMTIGFAGKELTGREVLEMWLYGELVHANAKKERKRLEMRESPLEDSYQIAVVGVLAELLKIADELRFIAQKFIDLLPAEIVKSIDDELGHKESSI